MAKYRPAGSKKATKPAQANKGAIPCLILVVVGIGIMCLLFYFTLASR
jgi:hypothetical protein